MIRGPLLAPAALRRGLAGATQDRLLAHLRTPLIRDGYALILSSGLTSVAGIGYWALAAREYSPRVVGLNSAAISVMMFLAGIAHLNLMSALIRFIPAAGPTTRRFVVTCYVLSIGLAGLVSGAFLLGLQRYFGSLGISNWGSTFAVWFVIGTMSWCIFVLQDAVLTGLRWAVLVPVENSVFTVGKLVLLALFASLLPSTGIFVSWTVAALATAIPTTVLILGRLVPSAMRASKTVVEPVTVRRVRHFVAVDYVASLCWLAATTLPPILVTERVGATANAYFSLAWFASYPLILISINMGASLVASAATEEEASANAYTWQTLINTARLVVPAVAVVILGAPVILRLFGATYAHHATLTLRLLAAAAIPAMINVLYVSRARLRRQMSKVAAVLGAECILALGGSLVLVTPYGGNGVAAAWLLSQTATAAAIVALEFGRLPLLFSSRRISRGHPRASTVTITEVLEKLPAPGVDGVRWLAHRRLPTVSDVTVTSVGPPAAPVAVIKLARSYRGTLSLRRHTAALAALHADERLGTWRSLLPPIVAGGEVGEQSYLVEGLLPGVDAQAVAAHSTAGRALVENAAVAAISELHRRTATSVTLRGPMLERLIGEPVLALRRVDEELAQQSLLKVRLRRLESELTDAFAGRTIAATWIHGDFALGNILVRKDGSAVVGIVDWEFARPNDLPLIDVLQLLLSGRMVEQRSELGDVVCALLTGATWSEREQAILAAARSGVGGDEIAIRPMLLLCWLRHVTANLTKSARYGRHRYWVGRNVTAVLTRAVAA
jgi:O-antigen/teichoic acid export membrane protein